MLLDFVLRVVQAAIVAPGAAMLTTNDLHGAATAPLARLGIPGWFIRWIGLWKGEAERLRSALLPAAC